MAVVAAVAAMGDVGAQSRLGGARAGLTAAPVYQRWSFATPFDSEAGRVTSASQLSVPIGASLAMARGWNVDVSLSATLGRVAIEPAGGGATSLDLNGLTDAKVRVMGPVVGERLWVTFGANLPSGLARLSGVEAAAIRVLGAPALRMTTPVLGSGAGFTAGGVFTTTLGAWAVGIGASYEVRGTYSPLEATLAGGGTAVSDLDPAGTVHVSLGLDGLVGQGRMSIVLTADRYGTDQIALQPPTGSPIRSEYRLGPALSFQWAYTLATPAIRELRFTLTDRYRSSFTDGTGRTVAGSSGNMLDAGASLTIGRPRSLGVVVGIDGAFDSGLEVDNSVATAAIAAATLTMGLDVPLGRAALQPFVKASAGRLDLGPESTTATGIAVGLSLRTMW